jgi:hypothetical protein
VLRPLLGERRRTYFGTPHRAVKQGKRPTRPLPFFHAINLLRCRLGRVKLGEQRSEHLLRFADLGHGLGLFLIGGRKGLSDSDEQGILDDLARLARLEAEDPEDE